MGKSQRARMSGAIRHWMVALNSYPGWKEWVTRRVAGTLHLDDELEAKDSGASYEFAFVPEVDRQHAVVYQYMGLVQTVETLRECEYYFRRYPFRGLHVSRSSHITNICEMYFGRFYEFKERLKQFFEAVKTVAPGHNLGIGKFIKQYERIFDAELRERHRVHHHGRFQDLAIDRVFLVEMTLTGRRRRSIRNERLEYERLTKEWARRVRRRSERMDEVLEAVADATLRTCRFLALYSLAATIAECKEIELEVPRH